MRDHRSGHDPDEVVDITAQLREAVRRKADGMHSLGLHPPKALAPRAKQKTNIRKARRRLTKEEPMTDLVRYQPPQSSLELAPAAWKLAEKIAGTEFVPVALRGKPDAVLACILAGHEAGISPMQALSKIHIIEGRPAMAAELMRALVLQHGHELNYDEVSTTSVTASGRRRGSERWTKVTWTMDDAKRGGLDGKQNWRRWPRAMLIARATAELCRMLFADVLAGISYTVEELSDGDVSGDLVDFGPPEVVGTVEAKPKRKTTQRAAITRQSSPAEVDEVVRPVGEVPPLPGEEVEVVDAEVVDAEVVDVVEVVEVVEVEPEPAEVEPTSAGAEVEPEDEWTSGEWTSGDFPATADPETQRRYTGPQIIAIKLADRFGIRGNSGEARAQRLAAIGTILGREITSSRDLTPAEVQSVIAALENWPADRPLGPPQPPEAPGRTETPPAPETAPEAAQDPDTPAAPVARRRPAASKAAPPARPAPIPPDQWTGEQWRDLLAERHVKVTETIREAQRLGALRQPPVSIAMLDDLGPSGLAAEVLGWIEDLSLERRPSR